jgi:hypothetical protein
MAASDVDQLRGALEAKYGGQVTFARKVPVIQRFGPDEIWAGIVFVFDLRYHPTANQVYAWLYQGHDGERRVISVLHAGRVRSPAAAVTAAVAAARASAHPIPGQAPIRLC